MKKRSDQNGKVKSGKSIHFIKEKDKEILLQIKQNPEGLRVDTIHKLTNIPKRTIYRILNKYLKKGNLINLYPIWKPNNGQSDFWQTLSKDNNTFELHNLSYSIRLLNKPDWWNQRKRKLMRLKGWQFTNHNFGKNNSNPYQQLINEDYVIQTYPESIIIIHRKRYYSDNPYEIIQKGINETLSIIKFLEQRFKFNFFPSGIPSIQLRSNDFNRLKDYMAEKCRKEGTRFLVETEIGKCWVDYSEPFGKESNTPDIQNTLEKHTKDLILNKPMTNSEIQQLVGQNAQNLNNYAVHLKSHVESIQTLSQTVKELRNEIRNLKNGHLSNNKP